MMGPQLHDLRLLAQQYTRQALMALVEIVADKDAPPAARVSAAGVLLDRGHGKAAQLVEVSGEVEHHLIDMNRTLDRPELKVIDDKAATMRVARGGGALVSWPAQANPVE